MNAEKGGPLVSHKISLTLGDDVTFFYGKVGSRDVAVKQFPMGNVIEEVYGPTTYYVDSANGNDVNNGTSLNTPFETFEKALSVIQGGDTIYLRGGTYVLGAERPNLTSNQSGSESAYTQISAYGNEKVVIDAHNVSNYGGLNDNALRIRDGACFIKVRGIEFTKAKGYGVCLTDNAHDIEFANCKFSENGDCGIYGTTNLVNVSIINCDSYRNYDAAYHGSNADGFGFKWMSAGSVTFIGCRAWQNSDDGWDLYKSDADFYFEDCWAYAQGENIWGDTDFKGDGNGFKLGSGASTDTLENCLSWDNGVTNQNGDGYNMNGNIGDVTLVSCISYKNERNNYNFYTPSGQSSSTIFYHISNSVNYITNHDNYECVEVIHCSWYPEAINIQASDWVSLDDTYAKGIRTTDGSLPDRHGFLVPVEGTKLDSILNDTGNVTGIYQNIEETGLKLFPNPTSGIVNIEFSSGSRDIMIEIINPVGKLVDIYKERNVADVFSARLDLRDLEKGFYFIRITDGENVSVKKIFIY